MVLLVLMLAMRTTTLEKAMASGTAGRPLVNTTMRLDNAGAKAVASISNGFRLTKLEGKACGLVVSCISCYARAIRIAVGNVFRVGMRLRRSGRRLKRIIIMTSTGGGARGTVVARRHADLIVRAKISTRRVAGARSGSTSRIVHHMPNVDVVRRGFIVMHKLSRQCGGI